MVPVAEHKQWPRHRNDHEHAAVVDPRPAGVAACPLQQCPQIKCELLLRVSSLPQTSVAAQISRERQGMQVDPRTVAGDGFMINLQAVLLLLAQPIIDATYSKVSCELARSGSMLMRCSDRQSGRRLLQQVGSH
jgi:hypothetical protein